MTKVLVVDDDTNICDLLKMYLEKEGYEVKTANDGVEGMTVFKMYEPDIVLLDIMMPKKDGLEVLKAVRQAGNRIPVLLLTAKAEVDDKGLGLDTGANDYLTKPFAGEELLARVRALSRRQSEMIFDKISYCDITLDTSNYTLSCGQKSVSLGAKEYEIMRMFLANPTQVIGKDAIISKVWGLDVDITENNVEAYMSFLRKKLYFIGSKLTIMTKRLLGYYLEKESD